MPYFAQNYDDKFNMSEQERHFYDKYAKHCLDALPNFLYDLLETGMAAKVGTDRSAELADLYGKGKRVCDALRDLNGIVSPKGKPVPAGFHVEIVTRPRGDEVFRACGYYGRIVEAKRYLYFVQLYVFLTPVPKRMKTKISGHGTVFRLKTMDLTRFDGLRWLELGIPEAAVFATLSRVVPRNLLIEGIVKVLSSLPDFNDQMFWLEICMGFANLRHDKKIFKMELLNKVKAAALTDERRAEIDVIYGSFIEEGRIQGRKEGIKLGKDAMRVEMAKAMLAEGDEVQKVARVTGLSPDFLAGLAG